MKKGFAILGVLVLLVVIVGAWFVNVRNKLVGQRENVSAAWAQVENVYQRRLDLIPNLVSTVKGYASHEKETLQAVIEARAKATQTQINIDDPASLEKFQQSQAQLSSALSRLMAVAESYPDLKANQNFLQLQAQLEGTENRIAVERRRFNEVARDYNVRVQSFPSSLVANFSGFTAKPYFQADAAAAKAPEVKF